MLGCRGVHPGSPRVAIRGAGGRSSWIRSRLTPNRSSSLVIHIFATTPPSSTHHLAREDRPRDAPRSPPRSSNFSAARFSRFSRKNNPTITTCFLRMANQIRRAIIKSWNSLEKSFLLRKIKLSYPLQGTKILILIFTEKKKRVTHCVYLSVPCKQPCAGEFYFSNKKKKKTA